MKDNISLVASTKYFPKCLSDSKRELGMQLDIYVEKYIAEIVQTECLLKFLDKYSFNILEKLLNKMMVVEHDDYGIFSTLWYSMVSYMMTT